jgi:hypothetical protein
MLNLMLNHYDDCISKISIYNPKFLHIGYIPFLSIFISIDLSETMCNLKLSNALLHFFIYLPIFKIIHKLIYFIYEEIK